MSFEEGVKEVDTASHIISIYETAGYAGFKDIEVKYSYKSTEHFEFMAYAVAGETMDHETRTDNKKGIRS